MYLQDNESKKTDAQANYDLKKIMGSAIKFLPLIYQLNFCEDSYYGYWLIP